ncbi:MAG: alkaline phosphatase family protein [Polyangiaceae bacterium]
MNRVRLASVLFAGASVTCAVIAACGGGDDSNADTPGAQDGAAADGTQSSSDANVGDAGTDSDFAFPTPIHHIIIVVKENHTFDNFFGEYDGGADTPPPKATLSDGSKIVRPVCPAAGFTRDFPHSHAAAVQAYNDGGFSGLDKNIHTVNDGKGGPDDYLGWCTFSGTNQGEIYWDLARNFTIADHFFTSMLAPSFPGHLMCAVGQSPAYADPGCDASDDTCTSAPATGDGCLDPFNTVSTYDPATCTDTGLKKPCFDIPTWMDLFPPQLTFGIYGGFLYNDDAGAPVVHTPVNAVKAHSTPAERIAHFHDDRTIVPQILEDTSLPGISASQPNVMYWDDSDKNSEHPPSSPCCGEQNDATIVNAAMSGKNWKDTVVLITFDDWGGMYDHEKPAVERCANNAYFSPGFRVPLLIISPYARKGYVFTDVVEQASIPKLIEELFSIPMTSTRDPNARDGKAGSLMGAFDFSQTPSAPVTIPFTSTYCPTPLDCQNFVPADH